MIEDSGRGFNQHDVRLYQPHYIHRLCQDNDTKALTRTLASDKTGVNLRDQNDMTPLHLTVVTADPPYLDSLMVRLIQNGADANAKVGSTGNTALHLAILYSKQSNAELSVPILLHEGATPTIRNHLGKTPFDYALANGYRRLAELLAAVEDDPSLARELDPYLWAPDSASGNEPEELHAAIRSGDRTRAGQLMRQVAQMAYRENCFPLHWAVAQSPDKRAMLQELLSNEADPQQIDEEKETPITLAIKGMNHDIEMLRVIYLLLLAGVPKASRNSEGHDALSLARQLGYADVEELLITGRNPDAKQAPRKQVTIVEPTPAPAPPPPPPAAKEEAKREAVQPRPPPKRAAKDPNSFTGQYHKLHELVLQKKGSSQIAKEMADLFAANPGLNPDVVTNDEVADTALHIVVRNQKVKAIEYLLEQDATVDVKNNNKETPLTLSRHGPWGWDRNIEAMLLQANKRQLRQRKQQQQQEREEQERQRREAAAAPAAPRRPPDPINNFTGQYHQLHQMVMQKKPSVDIANEMDSYFKAHPGLDPDLKTNDEVGDTALHMAVRDQKKHIIKCLLDHDATVNIKNKKKETPLLLSSKGPWGYDKDVDEMLQEANRRQKARQRQGY